MSSRIGMVSIVAALCALGLALVSTGCAVESGGGTSCGSDKCDGDSDFHSQLDGREDWIAAFLRDANVEKDGVLEADYHTVLAGVAGKMGCDASSVATFALADDLIDGAPFPRLISVACSTDDVKASEFFIAASFKDEATGDVDIRDVEMFSWDATNRKYRFYAFKPSERDPSRVDVEVEPKRCQGCHLTPSDEVPLGMPMTPIMNEINRPWTHWNAEPGFPSFDYDLPEGMETKPNFAKLLAQKGPASRFEQIIRNGGHLKVAQARLRERRNPASLAEVMNMLRPVFCSEQINYTSEDFDSGVLFSSAVVDPGIRNMYMAIRPDDWAWGWVNGDTMRLDPPATGQGLAQIPVRGNADIITEQQLVALRALTPQQVLRVRALDWRKPVFSEFRCGLWRNAQTRFETDAPSIAGLSNNAAAMPVVFEAIMRLGDQALDPGAADRMIVLDDAGEAQVAALEQALADGTLASASCDTAGFCTADLDQLGEMIDQHLQSFESGSDPRTPLAAERQRRICHILEKVDPGDDRFEEQPIRFENRPALPIDCP
jgi:hypothetical protein